ncbi:hypothetical protein HPB50_008038 [Hyalomma asiaticum]|uniref:Uncharacterized protein n=1 Tax=Hyalomma asiaticum TaxID=266040 RepID=A0ACB7TGU9_HYAAI|nr:hypothetical protein HPB50_008038 [Hyalomma asiaticum]
MRPVAANQRRVHRCHGRAPNARKEARDSACLGSDCAFNFGFTHKVMDAHASQLSRAIEWCDDQENCCKRMKELWRMLERQSDVERDLDAVHKQARELIETVDEIEEAARRNFDETSIFWEMMSDIRATLERIARD